MDPLSFSVGLAAGQATHGGSWYTVLCLGIACIILLMILGGMYLWEYLWDWWKERRRIKGNTKHARVYLQDKPPTWNHHKPFALDPGMPLTSSFTTCSIKLDK